MIINARKPPCDLGLIKTYKTVECRICSGLVSLIKSRLPSILVKKFLIEADLCDCCCSWCCEAWWSGLVLIDPFYYLCAACAVAEAEHIIRDALAQAENPHHSTVRCTAGH